MTPETTETFWRALAAITALTAAGSPVLVALVAHWRRSPKSTGTDADAPAPRSPSVTDSGTVQGMTLEMWGVVREQLRVEAEARLRAEVDLDVAEAERDLARDALRAAGLPVPTLQLPERPPGA